MSKQTTRQKNRSSNKQGKPQSTNQAQDRTASKPVPPSPTASQAQNRTANKQAAQQTPSPAQPQSKQATHQNQRQNRRATSQQRQAQERSANRTRTITVLSVAAAILVVVTVAVYYLVFSPGAKSQAESIYNPAYPPVDGIYCDQLEQTAFHIHAHLSVYINGQLTVAPANVGIADPNNTDSCFYWLHVHNADGIIHMEAPAGRTFTLSNFLDIWSRQFQQLSYPYQLDVSQGWTAYVNGKLYNGDFHTIPLGAHTLITLMFNSPNAKPDTTYNWGSL